MKNVYLLQLEGTNVYKIGYTKSNPQKRIDNLQTGNPYKLILIEFYATKRASKLEAALHNRYNSHKVNEDEYKLLGEWFQFDNDIVKNFKAICELIDNNFRIIEEMSTFI